MFVQKPVLDSTIRGTKRAETAIDSKDLPGHPIVLRLQEPDEQGRDVLRFAQSAEGMHISGNLGRLLIRPDSLRQSCLHETWGNRVNSGAAGSVGRSSGLHQPNDAGLRGGDRLVAG